MPVYLVRHAHAGSRHAWRGDDASRPLSDKGRSQAEHLAALVGDPEIALVASSPASRCVQTVEPIAAGRDLDVRIVPALNEGSSAGRVIEWLLDHAEEHVVACSHGDVIPKVLRRLVADGLETSTGALSQKGSMWVLEVEGGRFVRGTYHPPSTADD